MSARRNLPGALTYRGDLRDELADRVIGPTTYGRWVVVTGVSYDAATDQTRATGRLFSEPDDRVHHRDVFGEDRI